MIRAHVFRKLADVTSYGDSDPVTIPAGWQYELFDTNDDEFAVRWGICDTQQMALNRACKWLKLIG